MIKLLKVILVLFVLLIAGLPVIRLFYGIGIDPGFEELKPASVSKSIVWRIVLYIHIWCGVIALSIGWIQFSKWMLTKYKKWHRNIGKLYIITALICAFSGFYIGWYATGGWLAISGFISVSIISFYSTYRGFQFIKGGDIKNHQNCMTYSYATFFAAVTLRLYIGLSTIFTDEYILAYSIIAWISWLPNLLVAKYINSKRISEPKMALSN
jgi:uncharacterized membrane protein